MSMLRSVFLLICVDLMCQAEITELPTINWASTLKLRYNYKTEIRITDQTGAQSPTADAKLSMQISIARASQLKDQRNLLIITITKPTILRGGNYVPLEGSDPLESALFVTKAAGGGVDYLYVTEKETTFWVNIYKGVASLIQSRGMAGEFTDVDASGECRSVYRRAEDNLIERVKRKCATTELTDERHSRGEGQKVRRVRAGRSTLRIRTADGVLEAADGSDVVTVSVAVAGQVGPAAIVMQSQQELKLLSVEPHTSVTTETEEEEVVVKRLGGKSLMRMTALSTSDEIIPKVTGKQLRKIIDKHTKVLIGDDGPKTESVQAFKELLSTIRGVRDARVILNLLDDENYLDVAPTVLDATVVCATGPCIHVILQRLKLNNADNFEEHERLLSGLSHISDPDEATMKHLLKEAKDFPVLGSKDELDGVQAQLWATMGAMAKRYRLSPIGKYSKIAKDIVTFLCDRLKSSEKNEDVTLALLTALDNVGDAPEIAQSILGYLINSKVSHRVHCAAIDTLMDVGIPDQFRGLARSRALRLVQSRSFQVDVTARIRALDLLLSLHPTMSQLQSSCRSFIRDPQLRVAFINRFRTWCLREDREDLWDLILQSYPDLFQYPGSPVPAPHAHVSTFLAGNLSKGDAIGESAVDLITGSDGSVRRSDSSAQLKLADKSKLSLYRLVLYTDGLNTAGNSEESAGDVTAGITLSILGVSLRPVRFFSGYGGLMTSIWNAPTSLTPYLQLNVAFIDAQHAINFQNGFRIRLQASGLATINLSGLMSISLWSQKAEGQMKTTAAIGLSVNAELVSTRLSAKITKSGTGNFAMNFEGNAVFTSLPPKICFVASFPDTVMLWQVERSSSGEKDLEKGQRLMPGTTLSLGRSNERSCAAILN